MKMLTSKLIGQALDWAVEKCELTASGKDVKQEHIEQHEKDESTSPFSTDNGLMGPIMDRELISSNFDNVAGHIWASWTPAPIRDDSEAFGYGPTRLIAAARCYVTSVLGDEIDVPDSLCSNALMDNNFRCDK